MHGGCKIKLPSEPHRTNTDGIALMEKFFYYPGK